MKETGRTKKKKKLFTPRKLAQGFLGLLLAFYLLLGLANYSTSPLDNISLSEALEKIRSGEVEQVTVIDSKIQLKLKEEGKVVFTDKEMGVSFTEILQGADIDPSQVDLVINNQDWAKVAMDVLSMLFPLVFTGLLFWYIFKKAGQAQNSIFSFGKSKAKLFIKGKQNIKFTNVAGLKEAKEELVEIVDFLKNPEKYRKVGARTPKGVLLIGPSGVGKTLLARAVAGEANVPFFSMAGSEFMEMLVGVGASRTRDLFMTAKKSAPSIIFIDELDAIGRSRSAGAMPAHDEREQTLNQILVEMDGFEPTDQVVVVAASVTGETPILIKEGGAVKLVLIGEFIDQYYDAQEEGEVEVVEVDGAGCLGIDRKVSNSNFGRNRLYFKNSVFKKIRSVFRHKVKEIYEVEYLGGKIRATGNHSVFVRTRWGLETKPVSELKGGDILVSLPYKANRTNKSLMEVRAHKFSTFWSLKLPFFDQELDCEWQAKYLFSLQNKNDFSQSYLAETVQVSQGTVSNWQRGIGGPRPISRKYFKHHFPEKIVVTPELCRLLGYYTAEGYARWEVDFCFSNTEINYMEDLIRIVKKIFKIDPDRIKRRDYGAVNIIYSAAPLAKFLIRHCGKGAHNKHLPSFLFEAPYEYFIEFLRGYWRGDGHEDKKGRGEITSVSKKLILELNWLCRMHGIKTYVGGFTAKKGRRINGGKPLPETKVYRLGWGKTNNPFNQHCCQKTYPIKRPIIKKVTKKPFNGFVYDLCGVDNEAFFGGESPILLHNSNRGDLLDSALLRPGRFDRRIVLTLPDLEEREEILKLHSQGKPFVNNFSWIKVARRTVGFSGADLENMLNEAAILVARKNKKIISSAEIEEAALKVKLGPEKKRLQSKKDREMTAYHEAGHALITFYLPEMDLVERVSIVSRGLALGYTLTPPRQDRFQETKTRLLSQISALLAGRAAEELKFSEMTTGAAADIQGATRIAREMVVEYGMSDLGPLSLGPYLEAGDHSFRSYFSQQNISPKMQAQIDEQLKKIVDGAYLKAKKIIKEKAKFLDKIAAQLVVKETLSGEEIKRLIGKN